ncbi:MAG TPA: glycoside hydrolase family 38 C-terminal domain-containing protein, partial [Actinopolymorphaceae bacterium]|nr:glycoside hydrolase family 38 C-terminal domain-containing protein [Actinopolymorphaceae bacterium]
TKANIDSIRRLDTLGSYGELRMSSPPAYVESVKNSEVEFPVWLGDLQHHAAGCYAAHSGIKAWMRSAEHALLAAEKWALVAWQVAGTPYPYDALTHAWKLVLFNQFHDILPGTSIEPAYDDARDQLGEARSIARRTVNLAVQTLSRDVDIPVREGSQPVLVFNPHPWTVRTDVECEFAWGHDSAAVQDADGVRVPAQPTRALATVTNPHRLAFPVELPGLGYRLYWIGSEAASHPGDESRSPSGMAPGDGGDGGGGAALLATDTVLENPHLRVEVDTATGWLSSLVHKESGVDLVAGVERPHTVVTDDPTDTWGHRVVSYAQPGKAFQCQSVRLVEHGPVRAIVRIESTYARSRLVEELVLGADARHLRVRVTLDWHEHLSLLKLRFPTVLRRPTATYEIPYGHLERPADGAEEPGQTWVDICGEVSDECRAGLAVVNDAKAAYDVSVGDGGGDGGGDIGITAVRSPVYAWHEPRQLDPADEEVFSYHDQGRQSFSYLVVPHRGDWRAAGLPRLSAELAQRPQTVLESFHEGSAPACRSFVSVSDDSVVPSVLKRAEGGPEQLVVRAYESEGRSAVMRLDLPVVGRTVEAAFAPHEIKTFVVPLAADQPAYEADLLERGGPEDPGGEVPDA